MPSAEIIAIGTELLLGEAADTNTRFIARSLRQLGIDLFRSHLIGDNALRIAESIRQSLDRADIVITTGGLGPTVDDPTRQAVSDGLGLPLEFHPHLWDLICARIARYGRTPTENQKRQAYLPAGAVPVENPVGTAPAFIIKVPSAGSLVEAQGEKLVICLPGVPGEMETLLTDSILPFLQAHFDLHAVIQVRSLHVSGMGEGSIDDLVGDLEQLSNPTVGLTAHSGIVDIRIAAKAATTTEAAGMIATVEADLRSRLGSNIYGADEDTLEAITISGLQGRGQTLAVFEAGLRSALADRLARLATPVYLGADIVESAVPDLPASTRNTRSTWQAQVGLGVSCSPLPGRHQVEIILVTPNGEYRRDLGYGGHPRNAARWAANMALDFLRRQALSVP